MFAKSLCTCDPFLDSLPCEKFLKTIQHYVNTGHDQFIDIVFEERDRATKALKAHWTQMETDARNQLEKRSPETLPLSMIMSDLLEGWIPNLDLMVSQTKIPTTKERDMKQQKQPQEQSRRILASNHVMTILGKTVRTKQTSDMSVSQHNLSTGWIKLKAKQYRSTT